MSYTPPISDDVDFNLETAPTKPSDTVDFDISGAFLTTAQSTAAATTATAQSREFLVSAVSAQTTALETNARFFKFAAAAASAATQAETDPKILTVDASVDAVISSLTLFKLKALTENRRSIDGTDDTDATFQTLSDVVEYDQLPDDVEFDS
jgi:hypothetical protein